MIPHPPLRPGGLRRLAHGGILLTLEVRAEVTEELGSEVNVIFPVDAPPVLTEDVIAAASDDSDHDNVPLIADEQRCAGSARVWTPAHVAGRATP